MSSANHKLRLAGALAVLAMLALAVSCQGFFPHATLQSIALQPPTPTFGVGLQQPMQAWGTDSNNHRYQLTNGVSWQLSAPSTGTVATIDANSGTMTGANAGTITVTASSQGISGTTTATVVETVSSMTITPSNTSVKDDGSFASFTVSGVTGSGSQDITSLVTLTAFQNNAVVTNFPCTYTSSTNTQDCTPGSGLVPTGTSQMFSIVVTYGGYTGTKQVAATLTVTGP